MKKVVDSTSTSVVDDFHQLVGAKEKEGVCHLLANDGTIHWVDDDEPYWDLKKKKLKLLLLIRSFNH